MRGGGILSQLIASLGQRNHQEIDSWLLVAIHHTQRGEEGPNIGHECRLIFKSQEKTKEKYLFTKRKYISTNYTRICSQKAEALNGLQHIQYINFISNFPDLLYFLLGSIHITHTFLSSVTLFHFVWR
jgi:hypothetical protein